MGLMMVRLMFIDCGSDIDSLLHQVVTALADIIRDNGTSQSKQNFQSSSMTFITFQDLCFRQELLEYMEVHNNDASESSKLSWGKMCTLLLSGQPPGGNSAAGPKVTTVGVKVTTAGRLYADKEEIKDLSEKR
ncbi:hypothetical protein Tco_1557107 [Tanacetum coccineum]